MSTSGVSLSSLTSSSGSGGSPLSITGLASGLDTSAIISALMGVEREPVTHMTDEQEKLQGDQTQLQSIQGMLSQVALSASEFSLPSAFESVQSVTSSNSAVVNAAASVGAVVGGHEVEVTQLATSAQRGFTYTSPASEAKLTVDGNEVAVKAGETAKEFADSINASSGSTVFAAVLEGSTVVLSDRTTGSGTEFIKVTGAEGVLSENAELAREGKDAEFKVDGVAGTSASNTVTDAIAGVTLTLSGLTSATTGPVTIDVAPPGPSAKALETQVQTFVKLYNSTLEAVHKQLTTKPLTKPSTAAEFGTGTLFGDFEVTSIVDQMRQAMYEPVAGLPTEMSSLADIGVSTGAPTGGSATQSSLEGLLTLDPTKLAEAVASNPAGVQKMVEEWSKSFQSTVNTVAGPGGTLDSRITSDTSQISQLGEQITSMNEMLALREKALQQTYAKLEAVIAQNTAQTQALIQQEESFTSSTS
jgi:flagellar hook-associated protein 2